MRVLYLNMWVLFFILSSITLAAQSETPVRTSGFFTSFDDVKIYYEVQGEGFPIVLVHGFISSGESWKKTILYRDLLQAGYKVINLDMRGNGKSDKPHVPEAYEHDAEAKDIMGLLTFLDVKQYSAVGYSRGSIITSRLLLLDTRIKKGVLGGMGADFTDPEWPRRKMFYKALMGDAIPELAAMIKRVKDAGLDQLALAYLQKGQPSTSHTELGQIKKPVLVISGDKDLDNGSSQELASLIPTSKHLVVPGDHGTTRSSQEFSAEVIKFLQ